MVNGLFDGELRSDGTISNESELAVACPICYRGESNEWRRSVEQLRTSDEIDTSHWLFRTTSALVSEKQKLYIVVLLYRRSLPDRLKAVVAWMLDSALQAPPR